METPAKSSTRSAESLGKVMYETKPNMSNVVAGFILGVGLVVGGLLLTGFMMRQIFFAGGNPPRDAGDWLGAIVIALLGLALAVGGVLLVKESVTEERLPLAKGAARHLIPTKTTRTHTVVRCDGEEFYFDENVIPRTSLLAGPLSAAVKSRGIKWETDQRSS